MNEVAVVRKWGVFDRFLARMGLRPGELGGVSFLENPTEELDEEMRRSGRLPKLHGMAAATGGVVGRLEENYLFFTRRFPLNTANNTIGGGAVAAGDYSYFNQGQGDIGSAAGYASIPNLTYQQTNMASGGKIPTGRAFRMFDLAVSFNALAPAGDIGQMMDIANLRFEKQAGSLVIQHGPISLFPGGTGIAGFAGGNSDSEGNNIISAASNGDPNLMNVRRYRSPRQLNANEQFTYYLNCSSALPNANVAVALTAFVEVRIWLYGQVLDSIPS